VTCQLLISAWDHRLPSEFWPVFRPGKQRTGQVICVKDYIHKWAPHWGRRENLSGGNLIVEVTDASKADLEFYLDKATNFPRLEWGTHADGMQVVATAPDIAEWDLGTRETLRLRFPNTLKSVNQYQAVFVLKYAHHIKWFDRYFTKHFNDIKVTLGPRWLLQKNWCDQIIDAGGFGKCDRATFDRSMNDRLRPRLRIAA
jgi:hypothetical protein